MGEISRICFKTGDGFESSEIYLFTESRLKYYLIPTEAAGSKLTENGNGVKVPENKALWSYQKGWVDFQEWSKIAGNPHRSLLQ
jgi:hypothetical protein